MSRIWTWCEVNMCSQCWGSSCFWQIWDRLILYLLDHLDDWVKMPLLSSSLPHGCCMNGVCDCSNPRVYGTHSQWDHVCLMKKRQFTLMPPTQLSFLFSWLKSFVTSLWENQLKRSVKNRISSRLNSWRVFPQYHGTHLALHIVPRSRTLSKSSTMRPI